MARAPEKAAAGGRRKKASEPDKTAKQAASAEEPADKKPVAEEPVAEEPVAEIPETVLLAPEFPWPRPEVFGITVGEWSPRPPETAADRRAGLMADGLRMAARAALQAELENSSEEKRKEILIRRRLDEMAAENNMYRDMEAAGLFSREENEFHEAVMEAGRGDLSDLAKYLRAKDTPLHPEITQAIAFILEGNLLPPSEWGGAQYRVQAVPTPIEPIRDAIRRGELVAGAQTVKYLIENKGRLFSAAIQKVSKDIKCSPATLRAIFDKKYPELQSVGGRGPGARQQVKRLAAGARKKKQESREE